MHPNGHTNRKVTSSSTERQGGIGEKELYEEPGDPRSHVVTATYCQYKLE